MDDPAEQDVTLVNASPTSGLVSMLLEQAEIERAELNRTAANLCEAAAHRIEDMDRKIADLEPDAARQASIIEAQAEEIKRLRECPGASDRPMGDIKNDTSRFSVTLPIAIRRRREELGISQAELARRLDVSRQAVNMWESGANSLDFDNLDAVCVALGLRLQIVVADTPDTLAERLRQRLNARNMSALGASEKAGLGRDVVRDILRGKVKEPSYRSIVRLAEALDCDPIWLGGEP